MEHERGAFKVHSRDMLGAVKKYPEIRSFRRLGCSCGRRSAHNSCRKIRQMA
jgi:hypothetical protein